MTKIEKSIEIRTTPEEIFNYIKDFEKHHEWMPGLISSNIISEKKEGVGIDTHLVTDTGRKKIEVDAEAIEWDKNKKIAWEYKPPWKSRGSFILEPTHEGTKLTYEIEYEPLSPILGKIVDKLIVHKKSEQQMLQSLENLKDIIEK